MGLLDTWSGGEIHKLKPLNADLHLHKIPKRLPLFLLKGFALFMLARKQPNVSAAEALCLNPMLQQTGQKNSTLMTHDFSYPWYTQANMALGSLAALRIDWRRTSLQHLRLQLRLLLQHLLLPRRLQKGHLLAWKVMLSRRDGQVTGRFHQSGTKSVSKR